MKHIYKTIYTCRSCKQDFFGTNFVTDNIINENTRLNELDISTEELHSKDCSKDCLPQSFGVGDFKYFLVREDWPNNLKEVS